MATATLTLPRHNYAKSIRTYMMLILVTALLGGYYGFTQYLKLSGAQDALNQEQIQITDLKNSEVQSNTDYASLKQDFDQKYSGVLDDLQTVYPFTESYTDLTRLFDKFFQTNNTSFNPVFMSDLKFGQSEFDPSTNYAVLPVTMTISGTRDNFMKFLQFVENSGVLDVDKASLTRLMDIRSISINFTSNEGSQNTTASQTSTISPQQMLNVSISLNAYFQKPIPNTATTSPSTVSSS